MQTDKTPIAPAAIRAADMSRKAQAKRRCARGLHNPKGSHPDAHNADLKRARCRHCGCQLVRTHMSRSWCFTGQLG